MVLDGLARGPSGTFTGDGICDDGEQAQKQPTRELYQGDGVSIGFADETSLGGPESLCGMRLYSPTKPVKRRRDM